MERLPCLPLALRPRVLYKLLQHLLAIAQFEIGISRRLAFNVQKNSKENAMRKSTRLSLHLFAAAALMMSTSFAIAGGQADVNWSITVSSPQPAPRIYMPPPAVYVQPQPVYIRPQPVYIRPATIVQYDGPYYVEEARSKKRHHWKHRHHRHDD